MPDDITDFEPDDEIPTSYPTFEQMTAPVQVPMEDPLADGLHADIPAEEYHDIDRCSSSRLTLLERSPAHAKEAMDHPQPSTKSQRIGTATHTAVLEPELMDEAVAVIGQCECTTAKGSRCSYNGKVRRGGSYYCKTHDPGAEEAGEAYDGLVVSEGQHEDICHMRDAVHAHPAASFLLADAETELTALWHHEEVDDETGEVQEVACKARVDAWHPGDAEIIDLKTTRDASADAFQRSLWEYAYYRQLAFYRYGLRSAHDLGAHACYIIAVEKKAPFAVAVYEISETTLKAGWRQLEDLLATWAKCERTGEWPAYPSEAQDLDLPHWAWDKL